MSSSSLLLKATKAMLFLLIVYCSSTHLTSHGFRLILYHPAHDARPFYVGSLVSNGSDYQSWHPQNPKWIKKSSFPNFRTRRSAMRERIKKGGGKPIPHSTSRSTYRSTLCPISGNSDLYLVPSPNSVSDVYVHL